MNENLNEAWRKVEEMTEKRFGERLNEQSILFVIGLQELGKKQLEYKKEEKLDIIHVGICTVLSKKNYYKFIGKDDDGWPHFKNIKKLPVELKEKGQDEFMRRAIIDYFDL